MSAIAVRGIRLRFPKCEANRFVSACVHLLAVSIDSKAPWGVVSD